MVKYRDDEDPKDSKDADFGMPTLDDAELSLLKFVGRGPYSAQLERTEQSNARLVKEIQEVVGIHETDTGLAPPSHWDLDADRSLLETFNPLQIARVTKILGYDKPITAASQQPAADPAGQINVPAPSKGGATNPELTTLQGGILPGLTSQGGQAGQNGTWRATISIKQAASFVVGKDSNLAPTDLEDSMRVAVDRSKFEIKLPLPPLIDPTVSLMQVEERPDVTYRDIGGCKKILKLIRESLELPLVNPRRFTDLGIQPSSGLLFYGPPGTAKTMTARAVANKTESAFIRVIGSELCTRYVGEGARIVRDLFTLAKSKKSCIIFFDEIDSFALKRSVNASETGDSGVQRTLLELISQLDGFNSRGNIKVIMATNRPDILDSALMRPGRVDKKIEFPIPDQAGREEIFQIYLKKMSFEKSIRVKLLARLSPGTSGSEIRSICTEAGMFCIREKRRLVNEADFIKAIDKVVKGYKKFISGSKYLIANNI